MSQNTQSFGKKAAIPHAIAFWTMTLMFESGLFSAGMERKTGCEGLQSAVWQGDGHAPMMSGSTRCFESAE
jgi:hypothetical protein